jgi:hypothetical protein
VLGIVLASRLIFIDDGDVEMTGVAVSVSRRRRKTIVFCFYF